MRRKLVWDELNPQHQNLLNDGVSLFNAGLYFEAHEVWEALWLEPRLPSHLKAPVQGLIHLTVGCHHLQQGNTKGAQLQLRKALIRLGSQPTQLPQTLADWTQDTLKDIQANLAEPPSMQVLTSKGIWPTHQPIPHLRL